MSVTYGFYNSLNGDRKYNAEQVSSLFDGLIIDGVFASIGTAFSVKATTGITVNVGIGKAWFNHTWTLNDSILSIEAPEAEVLLDRIDAIVIEVDATDSVRANSIKFVKGTPSSSPSNPTLTNEGLVHQYPLCYIYRKFGSSEITQADITNMVGTESTPFVTAMLQTISLDELLGQWQSQLDQFVEAKQDEVDQWIASEESDFTEWFDQMRADLQEEQAMLDQWIVAEQEDFLSWYNRMKDQLGEDAAGNLQNQIDALIDSKGQKNGIAGVDENGKLYPMPSREDVSGVPVGTIVARANISGSEGYLYCNGAAVSRTTYAALYKQMGTTFGEGDGSTTFNLPNYGGRVLVGYSSGDSDFGTASATGGEKTHTLTSMEIPVTHVNVGLADDSSQTDGFIATYQHISAVNKAGVEGGDQPHNNLQPYRVVHYYVKY